MAEVTIRRCVLRVVRHGGWSWGPEPKALVSAAVAALPGLLAAELERVIPDEADGEISAPVRVDLRVSLAELRALARASPYDIDQGAASGLERVSSPIPEGVAESIRRALAAGRVAELVARATPPVDRALSPSTAPDRLEAHAAAVLRLLLSWHARARLEKLLRALPDGTIAAWHRTVLEQPSQVSVPAEVQTTIDRVLLVWLRNRVFTTPSTATSSLGDCLRDRLHAATELEAVPELRPERAAVRLAIDAHLPLPTEAKTTRAPAAIRPARGRRVQSGADVAIASVLPFLLLGPLHRIGWIEIADATLTGAELRHAWPALAVALATKVLMEPERGWRRLPATARAAATFAGDAELCPDSEIVELARRVSGLMPGLDAVVRGSLLDGRRASAPLVLCIAGSVRVLVDPDGAFLVALAADDESAAACAGVAGAPVFVPAEDANVRLLQVLEAAGVTFVTPAPPVRGERWSPVPSTRSPRLFTNGRVAPVALLDDTAARARDTLDELDRRPLGGRPSDPALDRGLALAAALALGTMAWELWRTREPTSPVLTLRRFGDLDGVVRFDDHQVRVRLPLGKRFRDLETAGFLADVPHVPWLDQRSVVFSGG